MKSKRWGWLAAAAVTGMAFWILARRRKQRGIRRVNRGVRVLVVGAGVVGSTYASRFAARGMDVTILARGERLDDIDTYGLMQQDLITQRRHWSAVRVLGQVEPPQSPQDEYDLIIVAVRHAQTLDAMSSIEPLVANTPVVVMQNNPSGAQRLCEAIEDRSMMMAFPATGGYVENGVVYSLPLWFGRTFLGESDGQPSQRLGQTARILRRAGIRVNVVPRIQDWLVTHAAVIAVLAGCVYHNGGRLARLTRRPREMQRYWDALSEALDVLRQDRIPITPSRYEQDIQRPLWRRTARMFVLGQIPAASAVVDRHLAAAPEEMLALYRSLIERADRVGHPAPHLRSLEAHFTE